MPEDLSSYSDQELEAIAGGQGQTSAPPPPDLSGYSDSELEALAGPKLAAPVGPRIPTKPAITGPQIGPSKPSTLEYLANAGTAMLGGSGAVLGKPGERTMLGRLLYGEEATPQAPDYGRGLNLPLVKPGEVIPETRTMPKALGIPLEATRGVLNEVGEFTTPANLAIMGGMGGAAPAGLGIEGAKNLLTRLVSAGFSYQMLKSAYYKSPELKKAWDTGDYLTAARLAGEIATSGGAGVLGLHHAASREVPSGPPPESTVAKAVVQGKLSAKDALETAQFLKSIETLQPPEPTALDRHTDLVRSRYEKAPALEPTQPLDIPVQEKTWLPADVNRKALPAAKPADLSLEDWMTEHPPAEIPRPAPEIVKPTETSQVVARNLEPLPVPEGKPVEAPPAPDQLVKTFDDGTQRFKRPDGSFYEKGGEARPVEAEVLTPRQQYLMGAEFTDEGLRSEFGWSPRDAERAGLVTKTDEGLYHLTTETALNPPARVPGLPKQVKAAPLELEEAKPAAPDLSAYSDAELQAIAEKKAPVEAAAAAEPQVEPPQKVTLPDGTELTYRRESDLGPFKTSTYDVTKSDIPSYQGSTLEIKQGEPIEEGLSKRVQEARDTVERGRAEQITPPAPEEIKELPEKEGLIPVYRGTGAEGMKELRPSEEGSHGPGVYFYDNPIDARAFAGREGGIVSGYVRPEDVEIHGKPRQLDENLMMSGGRVIVLKDPSKFIPPEREAAPVTPTEAKETPPTYDTAEGWMNRWGDFAKTMEEVNKARREKTEAETPITPAAPEAVTKPEEIVTKPEAKPFKWHGTSAPVEITGGENSGRLGVVQSQIAKRYEKEQNVFRVQLEGIEGGKGLVYVEDKDLRYSTGEQPAAVPAAEAKPVAEAQDVRISPWTSERSYADTMRRVLSRTKGPAFGSDNYIYTPTTKWEIDLKDGTLRKAHDISKEGFESLMKRHFRPEDEYTSYNPAAKKFWDELKERERVSEEARLATESKEKAVAEEKYRSDAERRAQIEEEMKTAKFKRETIQAPTTKTVAGKEDKGTLEITGPSIGGIIVQKMDGGGYTLTHMKSGMSMGIDYPTQQQAKVAAYRLSKEADWTQPADKLDLGALANKVHSIRHNPYEEFRDLGIKPKQKPTGKKRPSKTEEFIKGETGAVPIGKASPRVGDYVKYKNSGGAEFNGDVVKVYPNEVGIIPDGAKHSIGVPFERVVEIVRPGKATERANRLMELAKGEQGAVPIGKPKQKIDVSGIDDAKAPKAPIGQRAKAKVESSWDNFIRRHYDQFIHVKRLVEDAYGKKGARDLPAEQDPYKVMRTAFGGTAGGKSALAFMDYGSVVKDATKERVDEALTTYLRLKGKDRAISVVEEKLADRKQKMTALRSEIRNLSQLIKTTEETKGSFGGREATKLEALKQQLSKLTRDLKDKSFEASRYEMELRENKVVPGGDNHQTLARKLAELKDRASPEDYAKVEQYGKAIFDLNRKAWDLAGKDLISDELYNKGIQRGNDYVTMSRVVDDVPQAEGVKGAGMSAKQVIKPLEGSERELQDPIAASMNMHQDIIHQSVKNDTVRKFVGWANGPESKGVVDIRPLKPNELPSMGNGEISFREGGKLKRYQVDQKLADTINLADASTGDFVGKSLINFITRVTKGGITGYRLAFSIPNVVRDVSTQALISKAGLKNPLRHPLDLANLTKEWVTALTKQTENDPAYRAMMESGGGFSTMQSRLSAGEFAGKEKGIPILRNIGNLNQRFETATKLQTWKRAKAMGMSDADAAWETRNFGGSPDFGSKGTKSGMTGLVFLFLNARVQGIGQSLKGVGRNPARFGYIMAGYTAAQLAIQGWNNQFKNPDDGKPEWDHVDDTDKQNYTIIFRPSTEQKANGTTRYRQIRIPKSHLEQTLLNPIQEAISGMMGNRLDVTQTALDTATNLLPISGNIRKKRPIKDLGLGAVSSLNPVFKEGVEQAANFDTYRKVPMVSRSMEDLEPRYQYRSNTSELAKRAGEKFGVSPLRIEHAARSFGLGDVFNAGDPFLKDTKGKMPLEGDERIARRPISGPILGRFVGGSADDVLNRKTENFYDYLEKSRQARVTLNMLKKSDREEAKQRYQDSEFRKLYNLAPKFQEKSKDLSEIRNATRQVQQNERLSDDQKKAMVKGLYQKQVKILDWAEGMMNR